MRATRLATAGVGILTVLLLSSSLGAAATPLTPLVVDWQQYFRIDAQATQAGNRPVVSGTVWNTSSWTTKKIQLLVEGLDGNGQVVTQRVAWLGSDLTSGSHAYFQVPVPGSAASYRVSVFAYDSIRRH